jgi:hypothetical protein
MPDNDADKRSHTGSLGAGAESAAGMQGAQNPSDSPHAADELPTGRGTEGAEAGGAERAGSEPLAHDREHTPSYGGLGGQPRISSDQREPLGENPSPS